jgi:hypothetical protein
LKKLIILGICIAVMAALVLAPNVVLAVQSKSVPGSGSMYGATARWQVDYYSNLSGRTRVNLSRGELKTSWYTLTAYLEVKVYDMRWYRTDVLVEVPNFWYATSASMGRSASITGPLVNVTASITVWLRGWTDVWFTACPIVGGPVEAAEYLYWYVVPRQSYDWYIFGPNYGGDVIV